jgi:hypothetical protein
MNKTLVASVTIAGVALAVVLLYYFSDLGLGSRIIVGEMQTAQVTINDVTYTFSKEKNILAVYPWIETFNANTGWTTRQTYLSSPQEGETYPWLGINIQILEVHADRYVICITSRD